MTKPIYVEHIDFLRAIAVILVILFHLDVPLVSGGFLGVDVFFVISGYLITRNIKNEIQVSGNFDFRNFYIRRIRRLIPTLLLVLLLTFIFGFLFFPPSLFSGLVQSMFFSSFALSNFYFLSEINYFDVSSNLKPLLHTWSLGIEEQFYLLYPFTLFILFKLFKKKNIVLLFLLLFLGLSIWLNIASSNGFISEGFVGFFTSSNNYLENINSMQFFLLPFRVFEFLMGGILVFMSGIGRKNKTVQSALNMLGLAIIVLSSFLFDSQTTYLSTLNMVPCFGASLFIFNFPNGSLSKIYNLKFFKLTGKISYTLYLFHWPIIVFYGFVNGFDTNFIEKTVLIAVTFIISFLVYNYYENPLRKSNINTRVISNHGIIGLILLSLILISNIKISVASDEGWLWRVDKEKLTSIKDFENPVEYNTKNWGAAGYKNFGLIGEENKNAKPDMIWFGDSHAGHYSYGLDSILVQKHLKNIFMSHKMSTLHLPDIIKKSLDTATSKNHLKRLITYIKKNPGTPVVISHFWTGEIMSGTQFKNNETGNYENLQPDSNGYKIICEKIMKFSRMVSPRKLIIIGENPFKHKEGLSFVENISTPKYLSSIMPELILRSTKSTFKLNKSTISINGYFSDFFKDKKNIHFIDPTEAFCQNGECIELENGNIYFSDKDHLSKMGSAKAIDFFEAQLLEFIHSSKSFVIGKSFNHKSSEVEFTGWSKPEKKHRWSIGNSSEIKFDITNKEDFEGKIELLADIFAKQNVKIYVNDSIIFDKAISGRNKTLKMDFNESFFKNGKNNIKFEYSNPKSPGPHDKRLLALAFKSIKIE